MRRKLVLLLILCQLLALSFMAAKREYIRARGTEVYLRTAPIDPRDPLRGDFVRLRYAMSSVRPERTRGPVEQYRNDKDHPVYAVLKPDTGGIHVLDYLTDVKPSPQELFIKGYITSDWRFINWAAWNGVAIHVRYGIEQYFVEQGRGLEMEQQMGQRNELQIPLEMRVAIGKDGTALIKDYRWNALGIKLEILRPGGSAPDAQADQPPSPRLKITLQNASAQTLTLADPGDHCGFKLVTAEWATEDYPPADTSCDGIQPDRGSLITLQPEQEYVAEVDLGARRWHVIKDGKTQEIGALPGQEMFRIVYRSPDETRLEGLGDAYDFWRGELPSRAFNASGQID